MIIIIVYSLFKMTKVITDTISLSKYQEQCELFDIEKNLQNQVTDIHSRRVKQPAEQALQKQIMHCQSFVESGF